MVVQLQGTEWLTGAEFLVRNKGRIGRTKFYDLLAEGTIPSVRIGRKFLVPANALDRMLEAQSSG